MADLRSARIYADTAELTQIANQMSGLADDLLGASGHLSAISDDVASAWSSSYTSQFTEGVARIQNNVKKLGENTERFSGLLHERVQSILETEMKNKAIFEKLR